MKPELDIAASVMELGVTGPGVEVGKAAAPTPSTSAWTTPFLPDGSGSLSFGVGEQDVDGPTVTGGDPYLGVGIGQGPRR